MDWRLLDVLWIKHDKRVLWRAQTNHFIDNTFRSFSIIIQCVLNSKYIPFDLKLFLPTIWLELYKALTENNRTVWQRNFFVTILWRNRVNSKTSYLSLSVIACSFLRELLECRLFRRALPLNPLYTKPCDLNCKRTLMVMRDLSASREGWRSIATPRVEPAACDGMQKARKFAICCCFCLSHTCLGNYVV